MTKKIFICITLAAFTLSACDSTQNTTSPKIPNVTQVPTNQIQNSQTQQQPTTVSELGLTITAPSGYFFEKNSEQDLFKNSYRLKNSDTNPKLFINIDLDNEEKIKLYAENYKGLNGKTLCLDHGICDENFDTTDMVNLFKNQQRLVEGSGEMLIIKSKMYADTYAFPYQAPNGLKTISNQNFIIYNTSFVPSGEVRRNYITFIGKTRVTISVIWARDIKIENNFNQYDEQADQLISDIGLKKNP